MANAHTTSPMSVMSVMSMSSSTTSVLGDVRGPLAVVEHVRDPLVPLEASGLVPV